MASDLAVYAPGPARPTGGCGAVAMLIGPNAPIVFETGLRSSHMEHVYDFYKPDLNSEYPVVDGKLSIVCYFRALDNCYKRVSERYRRIYNSDWDLSKADFFCFHSPFNKLVQKSFGRLLFHEYLRDSSQGIFKSLDPSITSQDLSLESTYKNSVVIKAFAKLAADLYKQKVLPACLLAKQLGNTYCGSVYCSLASLINEISAKDLLGRRILLFSYGSGLASSLISFKVVKDVTPLQKALNLRQRLSERIQVDPAEYTKILEERELSFNKSNVAPLHSTDQMYSGTYYLTQIDDKFRRSYKRVPNI